MNTCIYQIAFNWSLLHIYYKDSILLEKNLVLINNILEAHRQHFSVMVNTRHCVRSGVWFVPHMWGRGSHCGGNEASTGEPRTLVRWTDCHDVM